MKRAFLVLVLVGCGGGSRSAPSNPGSPPPVAASSPATPGDAAVAAPVDIAVIRGKLEQLAARMCDCKDAACANGVSEDLARWRAEVDQPGRILSEADTAQLMPVAQRMATCVAEAMTNDGGSRAKP